MSLILFLFLVSVPSGGGSILPADWDAAFTILSTGFQGSHLKEGDETPHAIQPPSLQPFTKYR